MISLCSHQISQFCIFLQQKQQENELALKSLPERLQYIDNLEWTDRQLDLAIGVMAGNVFDWGAKEIVKLMETGDFDFSQAKDKLQGEYKCGVKIDLWSFS